MVIVRMQSDAKLHIPRKELQGLETGTPAQLAAVELLHGGRALHWETLDADFSIAGLCAGLFGTKQWMASLAGKATSEAKSASSRENGKKGGRPKNNDRDLAHT